MTAPTSPLISVVMPVYNAEKYLAKAVDSILQQSLSDFEFVIIDDGSTDHSTDLLKAYTQQDARIKLVSRENKGLVASLNEGIALAQAPIIARMDADDIAHPDRFLIQYQFLQQHSDCVCVGGRFRVIDEKSRFLIVADTKLGYEQVELSALQGITPICHPTAMLRKTALTAIGNYHEDDYPAEDLALFLNLAEIGKIDNVPDIILDYRIHEGSISSKRNELQMTKSKEICEKHWLKRGHAYEFKAKIGRSVNDANTFTITLRHGWWAFKSQEWSTAASYGLKAITINPFNTEGWRLLLCSLRDKAFH